MAMDANSRIAPAVHPLTGSTPPGAGIYERLRASQDPKASSAPAAGERDINALAQRLVALLKREPGLVRKLDMLRLHALLPGKQVVLEKVIHRTWRRIDRRTRRLASMKATTNRTRYDIAVRSFERLWWLSSFLRAYLDEVQRVASVPRHEPISGETPNGDAHVEAEFEAFIAEHSEKEHFGDARTLFRVLLGQPLRQAFKDHVALLATPYGERSNGR